MTPARVEKLINKVFALVRRTVGDHMAATRGGTAVFFRSVGIHPPILERIPVDDAAVAITRISDPNRKLAVASALYFALRNAFTARDVASFTAAQITALQAATVFFPYPQQPLQVRALVFLGDSPKMLSGDHLTKAEAHAWLSGDSVGRSGWPGGTWGSSARRWFIRTYSGVDTGSAPTPAVWSWLRRMLQSPRQRLALIEAHARRAIRFQRGPDGRPRPVEYIGGELIARLDELEDADLTDAVSTTFENARIRRQLERDGFALDEPLTTPPPWWVEDPRVKLLLTPRELAAEGDNMRHCAGGCSLGVKEGSSLIFVISLPSLHDSTICRSTVEVEPKTGEILQHRGYKNSEPDPACVAFLETLVEAWGERQRPAAKKRSSRNPQLWPYRRP